MKVDGRVTAKKKEEWVCELKCGDVIFKVEFLSMADEEDVPPDEQWQATIYAAAKEITAHGPNRSAAFASAAEFYDEVRKKKNLPEIDWTETRATLKRLRAF